MAPLPPSAEPEDPSGGPERTHPDRRACSERDAADPLAFVRQRFVLPEGQVYLDGNSLGALPRTVPDHLRRVVTEEWGEDLIRSWNKADWIGLPERVGARIAPLIGARPHEVIVADSTSLNLFKLVVGALGLRPERRTLLTEAGNFPTDRYMMEGACGLLGQGHRCRALEGRVDEDQVIAALDDDTALVVLTQVDYRSGRKLDLARITAAAHDRGALVLWDLAHSAGAFDVDLEAAGADLAVGCGYKYLNGGPGAPAFLYVADRWQEAIVPALPGWMGHAAPFRLEPAYRPAPALRRHLVGTPPILALAALDAALGVWEGVDPVAVTRKGEALTASFIQLAEARLGPEAGSLVSPREAARRGSQVCFAHPEAFAIMQALIDVGVIGDFREPDILRFGFSPLYVGFADVWDAVDRWAAVLRSGRHREARFSRRGAVT